MLKKDIKILFLLLFSFFTFERNFLFAKCLFDNCDQKDNSSLQINKKKKFLLSKQSLENLGLKKKNIYSKEKINSFQILEKEIFNLDQIFSTLLISNQSITSSNSGNLSYEIESDSQYFEGDIFYAQGNVKVLLPNGILTADKISYDKSKKLFIAYKNLNFKKGEQFFKADYLEYDFLNNSGYIKNVYGIIDFRSIQKDLRIGYKAVKNNVCKKELLDLNDLPSEVEFLSSSNERYKNIIGLKKLKLDFSTIKNWRFKSKRIDLKEKKWHADLIDFTNDPYNKPQLIIKSKNFVGEIIDGYTKFTSNSASINFEDKITLPIIGKRTITDEESQLRWGIGNDYGVRDGIYILRNFNSIEFNDNFSLDLQPYFLIQRALEGKSNSFREKGSTIFSDNVEKNIKVSDYFALNSKFEGNFYNWNLNLNSKLKTFNTDNFYDAFSSELSLGRNLYSYTSDLNKNEPYCDQNLLAKEYDNLSVNLGLYSKFDKGDIYSSFGTKLLGKYKFKKDNLNKSYSLVFDYGQYQAKSKNISNNNNYLKKLDRYGLITSLTHVYRILEFNKDVDYIYPQNKYSPSKPQQGLFLNAKIGSGFYEYSDNTNQSFISLSLGPSFTYGNLKRNYLDYTNISIFPEFIIKNGESPFVFDDFNNDSRIKFNLSQQLFGPLILGVQGDYNINTNSSGYLKFQNKKISLDISRRAYSLGLSYSENNKSILLGFEIFNFGDSNFRKDF